MSHRFSASMLEWQRRACLGRPPAFRASQRSRSRFNLRDVLRELNEHRKAMMSFEIVPATYAPVEELISKGKCKSEKYSGEAPEREPGQYPWLCGLDRRSRAAHQRHIRVVPG